MALVNGRKIRAMREAEQLSILELASRVGTSQTTLSHVETGIKQPSVALLKRIADYFSCTMDDFLQEERSA